MSESSRTETSNRVNCYRGKGLVRSLVDLLIVQESSVSTGGRQTALFKV